MLKSLREVEKNIRSASKHVLSKLFAFQALSKSVSWRLERKTAATRGKLVFDRFLKSDIPTTMFKFRGTL